MAAKSVKLEGYGTVMIAPINIKEKELETVDPLGRPVISEIVGTRAKTVHKSVDGTEIPSNRLCKKIVIDGEEIITPKFNPTKEVAKEDITELDENGLVYTALDRKFYNAVTDSESLKELVIKQNKTLSFPFSAGSGFKLWNSMLTNWNGKLLMVCCRGDLKEELAKYD